MRVSYYGSFIDMYRNKVELAPSSNIDGGIWLRINALEEPGAMENNNAAAHLSVADAKVLIAILEKAIRSQEEE